MRAYRKILLRHVSYPIFFWASLLTACQDSSPVDLRSDEEKDAGNRLDSDTGLDTPDTESYSHRYARYAFEVAPTQEEVSDEGPQDYEYNLGDIHLYTMASDGTPYQPDEVTLVSTVGMSFELPANALVTTKATGTAPVLEPQTISVFKAPLDQWDPPFVHVALDALYYIAPHWAKLAGDGVTLTVEAPPGWETGDTGILYLLGDYNPGLGGMAEYVFSVPGAEPQCTGDETVPEDKIPSGTLGECGVVSYTEGKLVTSPIPRFSWVGIGRPDGGDAGVDALPEQGVTCIGSVAGRLLREGVTPLAGTVAFCIEGLCVPVMTNPDGTFNWQVPNVDASGCRTFDFNEEYMKLEINSNANPDL